jgi:SAM-dependent methyltransferase
MASETLNPARTARIEDGEAAWNIVRCPICRSPGSLYESFWQCSACHRNYPRYSRILDLRVSSDRDDLSFAHLESLRGERERSARALAMMSTATFAEMVENYFSEFPTRPEIERGEKETLLYADKIAREILLQMRQTAPIDDFAARPQSIALEAGCGAAGLTGILAKRFYSVVALDADLDRMILAQKHCEELGLTNVMLLCAFGESMPIAQDAVDFIACIEVLEHATSQRDLLSELRRILRPGGRLYLTTPNRFTAGREPHVKLWGLGWLPRSVMNSYVRWRLGVPYVGKRNLSYWELRDLMRETFDDDFFFCRPRRSKYTVQARVANGLSSIPLLARLVRFVIAGYHVNAGKSAERCE